MKMVMFRGKKDVYKRQFNELSKYSYVKPNELFKAMYYFSLSPIQLVKKRKMSKEAIEACLLYTSRCV